ncbi:hypothetical protein A6R70_18470 [Agrobacterium rubi]|nr:hypothetical protein [Agrobacterium rubi]
MKKGRPWLALSRLRVTSCYLAAGVVVRIIKILLAVLCIAGACIILGYWLAFQAGLNGLYKCEDVACPWIVLLITGPMFSLALAMIASLIFIGLRLRKSFKTKRRDIGQLPK